MVITGVAGTISQGKAQGFISGIGSFANVYHCLTFNSDDIYFIAVGYSSPTQTRITDDLGLSVAEDYTELQQLSEASIFYLFQRKYSWSLIVGVGLMALQQFGGVNGIAFYASAIFISAGFSGSAGMIAMVVVQAATYGLPIVATKNEGPIDIHRVLDNGLFVDPHDHQSIANALLKLQFIADALLKLVADRQIF